MGCDIYTKILRFPRDLAGFAYRYPDVCGGADGCQALSKNALLVAQKLSWWHISVLGRYSAGKRTMAAR